MGFLSRLFGAASVPASSAATPSKAPEAPLAAPFTAQLHGQLSREPGNLVYGPASLRTALAMAAAGAQGETLAQMRAVLAVGQSPHGRWRVAARAKELSAKGTELREQSRLWAAKGASLQVPFVTRLREDFEAPLEALDFAHQPEASRSVINRSVAEATADRVRELVPARAVSPATKLVLTSAIYFKARWREPFSLEGTRDGPFQLASGPVHVPLMHQTESFALAQTPDCQVLELPYADGRMVMDVILPRAPGGLASVEAAFAGGALTEWVKALRPEQVDVTLPRFKASLAHELSGPLQAMGMTDAFQPGKADFAGIDGSQELMLSQVLHHAFVQVDEEGTEAAAASAVVMLESSAYHPEKPTPFHADHPFLFVIRDTAPGGAGDEPLFAGRILDPRP